MPTLKMSIYVHYFVFLYIKYKSSSDGGDSSCSIISIKIVYKVQIKAENKTET